MCNDHEQQVTWAQHKRALESVSVTIPPRQGELDLLQANDVRINAIAPVMRAAGEGVVELAPMNFGSCGLLSAMFDEKRLHKEVAPQMIELGVAVGGLLEGSEGDIFNNRLERKPLPVRTNSNNTIIKTEETNDLEARTRRARSARSVRARDGRR